MTVSAVVKLSSKMPGDAEINGLDSWRGALLGDPANLIVAVVYLDVQKITEETDTHERIPTVRVRRIEPLGNLEDVPQAVRDAVAVAEEERTGRKPLPFEIVTVGELGEDAYSDSLLDET